MTQYFSRNNSSHIFEKRRWLICIIIFWLGIAACSRSPWMKPDGHEVSPQEQLVCTQEVQTQIKGQTPTHDEMVAKIETCMIDKGYQRRHLVAIKRPGVAQESL